MTVWSKKNKFLDISDINDWSRDVYRPNSSVTPYNQAVTHPPYIHKRKD